MEVVGNTNTDFNAHVDEDVTIPKSSRSIMLTGFHGKEKERLNRVIQQLHTLKVSSFGDIINAENFHSCTHVIAKKPCRSEKFLCSCASGKWILCANYLFDSYKASKWLKEEDYEWGNLPCSEIATPLALASRRWRKSLKEADEIGPFHNCFMGLMVKRTFDVFKRLIEVGGGKAVNLLTNQNPDVTHVISDFEHTDKAKKYHNRGIPCVRCEYLAERIVQDPIPPTKSFSWFDENPKTDFAIDDKKKSADVMESNQVPVDEPMDVDVVEIIDVKPAKLIKQVNGIKITDLDDHVNLPSTFSTPMSRKSCSSIFSQPKETDLREPLEKLTEDLVHHDDVKHNVIPERGVQAQTGELSINSLEPAVANLQSVISNEIFVANEIKQVKTTPECQDMLKAKIRSTTTPQTDQERKEQMKTVPDLSQDDKCAFPISQEATVITSMLMAPPEDEKCCIPEVTSVGSNVMSSSQTQLLDDANESKLRWSSKKRELIDEVMNEIRKDKGTSSEKALIHLSNHRKPSVAPHRIGRREMTMLENSVDVSHSSSVLITCRMLFDKEKYPSPDLLYLLMKKYLLDSDCARESAASAHLLQSLLRLHPPSSTHILQDDIYTKALSITSATNSTLLTLSKLTIDNKVRLWSDVTDDCAERRFFKTVLKQAVGILQGFSQRRRNAVVLLSVLASILEEHHTLTDKIFWSSGGQRLIKLILGFFRNVIEADMKNKNYEESDDDIEIVTEENNVIDDDDDDDNDEEDDRYEVIRLVGEIRDCLSRIIDSLFHNNTAKRPETLKLRLNVVGTLLADVFGDAGRVVVRALFDFIHFPSKSDILRIFLDNNFSDRLAKVSKEEPLSIHAIVQRYFYFLPKLPNSTIQIQSDAATKQDLSPPRQRSASEDKVQIKPSPHLTGDIKQLSSANVNRRNFKGETALHRACINNQHDKIVQLLAIPGVDPNAGDNAGWTPLSEACNLGHLDCVKELLRLPLKSKNPSVQDADEAPLLEIDLLSCPDEGTTPLHDTLNNGHLEIAKLLLEKGGVELLYVTDKQGNTPLDVCETEEVRSLALELALELSSKECESELSDSRSNLATIPTYFLPESYVEVLPTKFSAKWLSECEVLGLLIHALLDSYVREKELLSLLLRISRKSSLTSDENENLRCFKSVVDDHNSKEFEVSRIERDISYLLNWEEIEKTFKEHLITIYGISSPLSTFSALNKDVRSILVNIF